jgi:hypothetical protein
MNRQRKAFNKSKEGIFNKEVFRDEAGKVMTPGEVRQANRNNRILERGDQWHQGLPEFMQGRPGSRDVMDTAAVISVLPTDRRAWGIGGGLLGLGAAAATAQAYADQTNEFGSTNPIAVVGRALNNTFGGTSVGGDPLASARNNVSNAAQLVGTEAMLEAITQDQVNEMRGINEVSLTPMEIKQNVAVQQMIDERAAQLMQQPIQKADGSVGPMPFDTAQNRATEQVHMELRAAGVY